MAPKRKTTSSIGSPSKLESQSQSQSKIESLSQAKKKKKITKASVDQEDVSSPARRTRSKNTASKVNASPELSLVDQLSVIDTSMQGEEKDDDDEEEEEEEEVQRYGNKKSSRRRTKSRDSSIDDGKKANKKLFNDAKRTNQILDDADENFEIGTKKKSQQASELKSTKDNKNGNGVIKAEPLKVAKNINNSKASLKKTASTTLPKPSRIPLFSPSRPSRAQSPFRSPVAQKSTGNNFETNVLPYESSLNQAYLGKDLKGLLNLMQDLTSQQKIDQLFNDYKNQVEETLAKADNLIESLTRQVTDLQRQLKTQNGSIQSSGPSKNEDLELILQLKQENAQQNSQVRVIFDFIELLTNLTCLDFLENEEQLIFIMKQSDTESTIHINYKLIINRLKNKDINEIIYIPLVSGDYNPEIDEEEDEEDFKENLAKLHKVLPEYLLDNLTFPYSNLSNFYAKINRSLNKNNGL
ncbi:hypothetical protein PACTADRAFT_51123 [Pachysolen tannophilus NRRL Y-2460]|uniref:Monopolin complex subunit Csm1/Pcs1 C-terminal domain-containing protein n=1 Tax=Pachysolen tannophilus NRRL Y-2460 TaxID=669874 RepID=A0A1E4TR84_PACTA|nr:hypothetical protein PACTADRAFT_51123 [Pachysolen tannophilus NRRL Y-2460]